MAPVFRSAHQLMFPKGSGFQGITIQSVKRVKEMLNRRPRAPLDMQHQRRCSLGIDWSENCTSEELSPRL